MPDSCICERYHVIGGQRVHWCILAELSIDCQFPAKLCRCKDEIESEEIMVARRRA